MRLKPSDSYSFGESNSLTLEDAALEICRDWNRDFQKEYTAEKTAQAFARLLCALEKNGMLSDSGIEEILNDKFIVLGEDWENEQISLHGKLG